MHYRMNVSVIAALWWSILNLQFWVTLLLIYLLLLFRVYYSSYTRFEGSVFWIYHLHVNTLKWLYNIFHILRTYFLAAHYDVYMYSEAGQALDHSYRSVNILLKWKLVPMGSWTSTATARIVRKELPCFCTLCNGFVRDDVWCWQQAVTCFFSYWSKREAWNSA